MAKPLVYEGDCLNVMQQLIADGVQFDSCVTDPPYHLTSIVKRFGAPNAAPCQPGTDGAYRRASAGFMGKTWDGGDVAFQPETWRLVFDLLKPGGHLLAFSGTRTYHRMAVAIEDAGFEIRDMTAWLYGSGFPKSHDVSKALDKAAGATREVVGQRVTGLGTGNGTVRVMGDGTRDITAPATMEAAQWQGWGTALKPALEPICVARKPLIGTVAANVLAHGTGALNIDGCRVPGETPSADMRAAGKAPSSCKPGDYGDGHALQNRTTPERWLAERPGEQMGRWPANVIHDGSAEVTAAFPDTASGIPTAGDRNGDVYGDFAVRSLTNHGASSGSAARFFYSAKADSGDRLQSKHPTVKPVDLMAYLCRLVTPPGGTVLDPFAGSGTTGMACMREGFNASLIEREPEYVADIKRRLAHVDGGDLPIFGGAS